MGHIKSPNGNLNGMCVFHFHGHFHRDEYRPKGLELLAKSKCNAVHFPFGNFQGGDGGRNNAWDRKTMFSQLAKRSASQRVLERAGKTFAVNSAARASAVLNDSF